MPTYTEKLHLEKPNENEYYDVEVFNANYDKIDDAIDEASRQGGVYVGENPPPKPTTWIDTSTESGGGTFVDLFLMCIYPVGSIYMSVNDVSPQNFIGGTWEKIKDKFLLASGDTYTIGSTGGSADAVVVNHTHGITGVNTTSQGYPSTGNRGLPLMVNDYTNAYSTTSNASNGVDGAGKNLPPYLTVNVWKRIA